jgi:hypothetical protein
MDQVVLIDEKVYEQLKVSLFNLSKNMFRQFISKEESGEYTRQQKVLLMISYIEDASKKMFRISKVVDE